MTLTGLAFIRRVIILTLWRTFSHLATYAPLWGVIDKKSNHWVSPAAVAPVAEVVDAIHNGDQVLALFPTNGGRLPEREFEVVEFDDGTETIELDASNAPAPEIRDMIQLDDHSSVNFAMPLGAPGAPR